VALLATVLVASLWPQDDGGTDPSASAGVSGSLTPGGQAPPARSSSPPDSAGLPTGTLRTRLRNLAADLCLDIKGGNAKAGAGTELDTCSSAGTQKWLYEKDGLLRSAADPELCLDSHVDAGVVILGRCAAASAARGDDVRYDLTVQGELLPRWQAGLAVAPSSDDEETEVVVKIRDRSDEQRWLTDDTKATPESLSIAGTGAPSSQAAADPSAADTRISSGPACAGTTCAAGPRSVEPDDRTERDDRTEPAPSASSASGSSPYAARRATTADDSGRYPVDPLPLLVRSVTGLVL
jgi:hypothetical protein